MRRRSEKKYFYLKQKSRKNRNKRRKQNGGEPWTNPAKSPVGFSFKNGDLLSWPGVYAANGGNTENMMMSNHYPLSKTGINVGGFDPLPFKENNFPFNPPEHYTERGYENQKGGKRYRRKSHKNYLKNKQRKTKRYMRGGFFGIGENLVNFGRDIKYRANSFYNDLMGTKPPVDPSPLVQPIDQDLKILNIKPIDLPKAYKEAGSKVLSI